MERELTVEQIREGACQGEEVWNQIRQDDWPTAVRDSGQLQEILSDVEERHDNGHWPCKDSGC